MSTFTTRHYQVVADQLNAELIDPVIGYESMTAKETVVNRMAQRFITVFSADNPGFDRDRFINAVYEGLS